MNNDLLVDLVTSYSKHLSDQAAIERALRVRPRQQTLEPAVRPRVHRLRDRLTAEDQAAVLAAYQAGVPVKEIMTRFGLGKTTLGDLLNAAGVRRRHARLTEAESQEAVRRYQAGQSLETVGRALGRDGTTILHLLRRRGVAVRDTRGRER